MAESCAAGSGNRVALYSVESLRRSLALDPDPAGCERPPHIPKYVCVCVRICLCMGMCASAVSEPRDAHPPISRNRAEHEMLGERSDLAAGVVGLCSPSEGM